MGREVAVSRHLLHISQFQTELDRLFAEALNLMGAGGGDAGEFHPGLDVVETGEALLIVVEVPGMAVEDLTVEVEGGTVTVRGVKPPAPAPPDAGVRYHRLERQHGTFVRRVQLAWPVNTHRGQARLTAGVLTVEFPKIPEQRHQVRRLAIDEVPAREGDDE